jgi:hypothetical protein
MRDAIKSKDACELFVKKVTTWLQEQNHIVYRDRYKGQSDETEFLLLTWSMGTRFNGYGKIFKT